MGTIEEIYFTNLFLNIIIYGYLTLYILHIFLFMYFCIFIYFICILCIFVYLIVNMYR